MTAVDKKQEPRNLIELIKRLRENGVPEEKYKDYMDRFLETKARKKGIPLYGNFELTPLCNLDCKMCYVHLSEKSFSSEELMPKNIWKDLIDQAYDSGMRHASLTGGECLTYPGFDDVYLHLYGYRIKPSVLSNGVMLDKKIDLFKAYPPEMIQVTVYGSDDDSYERVTGRRVFEKVHRNLIMLKENRIPSKVSVTPNSFLEEDVYPLLELLKKMEMPFNINANLIPPRKNTGRSVHDVSVDEYVKIFKYRAEMEHHEFNGTELSELPDESHGGKKKYGMICGAGRSSFGIRYDGKMCLCLSLGDDIAVDVLESGFSEAWKKINNIANNYPRPEECGDCIYFDRCLPCIAMHQNAPIPGHCDPRICERTKKLMSIGFIPVPKLSTEK